MPTKAVLEHLSIAKFGYHDAGAKLEQKQA